MSENRITVITFTAALIGLLTVLVHASIAISLLLIFLLPSIVSISPQSTFQLSKYTTTTFIFGIIIGLSSLQIFTYLTTSSTIPTPLFQIYLITQTIYYYFQFQLINNFHHNQLTWQSFLIYHSRQYMLANMFMLSQHVVTRYLLGFQYKKYHMLAWPCLVVAVCGLVLRICAFFTAKSNFTHLVSFEKVDKHRLVTHGVYAMFRHPSYTGFYYYAVFGQIFVGNWVSAVLTASTLTRFFTDRIEAEQMALTRFFVEYAQYKSRTGIYIPFVKNPVLEMGKYGRRQ